MSRTIKLAITSFMFIFIVACGGGGGGGGGGSLSIRFGVMRILIWGACLSALSNLLFSWLSLHGHDLRALIGVISADNLSSGIASAAFIAYLSSLTNIKYSATQYAMLSSVMLLLPKFLAGFSGLFVNSFGYSTFLIATALLGCPVLLLLYIVDRQTEKSTLGAHARP